MTASITAGMIMNAVTATVPAGFHPRRLIPETDAAEDITDITDIITPRNGLCRRGVLVYDEKLSPGDLISLIKPLSEGG